MGVGGATPPLAPPKDSGTQASVGLGWVQGERAPSAPPSPGCWKRSKGTLLSALLGHTGGSSTQGGGGGQPMRPLPGSAQPLGRYLLPTHSPACPCSCILEPPQGGKASCIGPIHGRCQGWAAPPPPRHSQSVSPPPCSTMRGALCRAGVQGTSRQGKEAGTSLDQVGTLSTSDQEHFPPPRGLPPLVWGRPLFRFLPFLPVYCGTTSNTGALANGHRLQQLLL